MYPVRERASRKPEGCLGACKEYVSYMKENNLVDEIRSVPLEILREFLIGAVEYVRPSDDWVYSDNIAFEVKAGA